MVMTSPTGDVGYAFPVNDGSKFLVCSAEQGFVSEALNGKLIAGKSYFSVSPCFRGEELDETHSQWFMKLELFSFWGNEKEARAAVNKMVANVLVLADMQDVYPVSTLYTDIGIDVMVGDIEIGSYGVRLLGGYWCAYGTGLALPRFSYAKEIARNGRVS